MSRHLTWAFDSYIDHIDGAKMCYNGGNVGSWEGMALYWVLGMFDILDELSESMAFEQAIGLHHRMPRHRELDMLIWPLHGP